LKPVPVMVCATGRHHLFAARRLAGRRSGTFSDRHQQKVQELENKLRDFEEELQFRPLPDREILLSLAQDLLAVWNLPSTDMRLKQRLIRTVIDEIVVDVDSHSSEVILVIHWTGGRHSELRVKKNEIGKHRRCTDIEPISIIRQMANHFTDAQIAATLNRLGLKTGAGNTWNESRVHSAREYHQLPATDPQQPRTNFVTLREAAQRLDVSLTIVRRLIAEKTLPASQVVMCASWQIPVEALNCETVRVALENVKKGVRRPQTHRPDDQDSLFSST